MTFDIFNRAHKYLGNVLNIIHNITDIDDKIITAAANEKITEQQLANKYKKHYIEMLEQANIIMPNSMPTVVDNMGGIISFIEELIKKGNAYEVSGSVYFSVESVSTYGHLSKRKLDEAKNEKTEDKRHPADFAVWKRTEEGVKFESPWSKGRPGWHTECVVFVNNELEGKSLDIHGGGIDLLFPHHENEDVQYAAINDCPITKEWVHTGHISIDDVKMSKSIGNVWLADEFFENYSSDVLRYIFLTSSVSAPINVSTTLIEQVVQKIKGFKKEYIQAQLLTDKSSTNNEIKQVATDISNWNFSQAMVSLNSTIKEFRKNKAEIPASDLIGMLQLMGFSFTKSKLTNEDKALFKSWEVHRSNKEYEKADEIRKVLLKLGHI